MLCAITQLCNSLGEYDWVIHYILSGDQPDYQYQNDGLMVLVAVHNQLLISGLSF